MSLQKQKMCEGCGLKQPTDRLASEGKRWCAGCGVVEEGAVSLQKPKKRCQGCGLKTLSFGLPSVGKKRWCGGCAKAHVGAENLQYTAALYGTHSDVFTVFR